MQFYVQNHAFFVYIQYTNMSDNASKYLLYISLILGSIGTYNAISSSMSSSPGSEEAFSELLTGGQMSSSDLTAMLSEMSRKVDEISAAKAANDTTISTVTSSMSLIKTDVDTLSSSLSAYEAFVDSFNSKSSDIHIEMAHVQSALSALTDFGDATSGTPVEVDSTFVTNLSKRIALLEASTTTSKEASLLARGNSELNKGTIARLNTSVKTLQTEFTAVDLAISEVTQLKEQVNSGTASSAISAMTTRLNGLTSESESISSRLVGVETWVQGRVDTSKSVTVDAGAGAVTQAVLDRLTDAEGLTDINSNDILTITGDVNTNTADIGAFVPDLQEQISTNKSNTSAVLDKADSTLLTISGVINPRISDVEADIETLTAKDLALDTKIELVEGALPLAATARELLSADLVAVSQRVTDNLDSIGNIEDTLLDGDIATQIEANAANIVSLAGDANFLAEKLVRSGDDIVCNGKLIANNGADISLSKRYLRMAASNDLDWLLYMEHSELEGPSGATPTEGFGFAGHALRARVHQSANGGFILENSNDSRLMSVRGSDGLAEITGSLNVMDKAVILGDGDYAYFGHKDFRLDPTSCALAQHRVGHTEVAGKSVLVRVDGTPVVTCSAGRTIAETELIVNHAAGTGRTHFREDSNYITTGAGKQTYFRFGGGAPTVAIRDKEVTIDGTDVLAHIKALQTRVAALESITLKKGTAFRMYNRGAGNKYLRAKSDGDGRCDTTTKDDWTIWTPE